MYARMTTLASLVLLSACTDIGGVRYDHVGNYYSDEEIDTIRVDGDSADVRLSGTDVGRVEVVEYALAGGRHPDTLVDVNNGVLTIESDCGNRSVRCGSKFEVDIPADYVVDVYMDVGAGNVSVWTLEGTAELISGSGNVVARDFIGPVWAGTGSGNVHAVNIEGDVILQTGSGNVEVDAVIGDLWADTGSGNVDVTGLEGTEAWLSTGSGNIDLLAYELSVLTASAESGNITATAICDLVATDIETGSGDVDLDVTAGSYDIEVNTASGNVRLVEVIDDPTAESTIDVVTGSGNVTITGH